MSLTILDVEQSRVQVGPFDGDTFFLSVMRNDDDEDDDRVAMLTRKHAARIVAKLSKWLATKPKKKPSKRRAPRG